MTDDEKAVDAIVGDLWLSLSDDWTALSEITRDVQRHIPGSDPAEVRRVTELVVRELVGQGVRIGEIYSGPGFTPWEGDHLIERLLGAWDEFGHEMDGHEVAWFDLPLDIADAADAQPS